MRRLLFCFLLMLVSVTVNAAEQTRPKVGLVLSGGGAKGAYQVGVLKALREITSSLLHTPLPKTRGWMDRLMGKAA